MQELWQSMASLVAMGVVAFFTSNLRELISSELFDMVRNFFHRLFGSFNSYCYFEIKDSTDGVSTNELYDAVQLYLSASASVSSNRLQLSRNLNSKAFTFTLSQHDQVVDIFQNITVWWEHLVSQRGSPARYGLSDEKHTFVLKMQKKDKAFVIQTYLDHIMERADELRRENEDQFLYTNPRGGDEETGHPWQSVLLNHPSTFDTLAMEPARKKEILDDLTDFSNDETLYKRTGRAWKRGYLLYGPPGTGKSSMIAAMANYLHYDVYDLDLTGVRTNSELRTLLMRTTPKSIIVIEDIDCSVNFMSRIVPEPEAEPEQRDGRVNPLPAKTITLSGLLNFTDGLWSCCGCERLFVFTTNHVDRLDPALLRSGRMDKHILMGYCSFSSVKLLLKNYIGWDEAARREEEEESLVRELEAAVGSVEMTPADVSGILIKNRRKDKYAAMHEILQVLKTKEKKISPDVTTEEG